MERELTRIPVVARDELAPESVPHLPDQGGEIVLFTAAEYDRLNVFRNMIDRVLESEKDQREKGQPAYFGSMSKDGNVTKPYIRLDADFRAIWSNQADALYNGRNGEPGFTPQMKEVATEIVAELKEQYRGHTMTTEEARTLFERTWDGGAAE